MSSSLPVSIPGNHSPALRMFFSSLWVSHSFLWFSCSSYFWNISLTCSLKYCLICDHMTFLVIRLRNWPLGKIKIFRVLIISSQMIHGTQCSDAWCPVFCHQEYYHHGSNIASTSPLSWETTVVFPIPYTTSCKQILKSRPQSKTREKSRWHRSYKYYLLLFCLFSLVL